MTPYLYVLGVIVVLLVLSAVLRGAAAAANPAHDLGAVASSLGFQVTEGDARHNLVAGARGSFLLAMFGISRHNVRARAEGWAGPYPAALELHDKWTRVKLRYFVAYEKDEFAAQLILRTGSTGLPFEAWRVDTYGPPSPRCGFPVVAQGPSPAGPWFVASPAMQARDILGPVVHRMAAYAPHLHIIASQGTVAMPFTRVGLSLSVQQLPSLRDELVRLAGVVAASR